MKVREGINQYYCCCLLYTSYDNEWNFYCTDILFTKLQQMSIITYQTCILGNSTAGDQMNQLTRKGYLLY